VKKNVFLKKKEFTDAAQALSGTTPEKFENGAFTALKTHQMSSAHTKTQSRVFKFLRCQERFRKAPFS